MSYEVYRIVSHLSIYTMQVYIASHVLHVLCIIKYFFLWCEKYQMWWCQLHLLTASTVIKYLSYYLISLGLTPAYDIRQLFICRRQKIVISLQLQDTLTEWYDNTLLPSKQTQDQIKYWSSFLLERPSKIGICINAINVTQPWDTPYIHLIDKY